MAATFMGKLVKKTWVFFVVAAVIAIAGTVDLRLHGAFGSGYKYSDGGQPLEEPRNLHPKHVSYEIFGPAQTRASINYMDDHANAKRVDVSSLPWSLEFTMTTETGALNIVAQGDSGYLGCRITVNGEVKDEYVARTAFAQTYCEVRSE